MSDTRFGSWAYVAGVAIQRQLARRKPTPAGSEPTAVFPEDLLLPHDGPE